MAEQEPDEIYERPAVFRHDLEWHEGCRAFDNQAPFLECKNRSADPTGWQTFLARGVVWQEAHLKRERQCMLRLGATFGFMTYAVLLYAVIGDKTRQDCQGQYVFEIAHHLLKMLQGQVGTAYLFVTRPTFITGWFAIRPMANPDAGEVRLNLMIQWHNLRVLLSSMDYAELYYSVCLTPLRGMRRGTPLHPRSTVCFDEKGHTIANRSVTRGGLLLIVGFTEVNSTASAAIRAAHDRDAIFSVSVHCVCLQ